MGSAFTELNTDFGELCDGVMDSILDEYEKEVGGSVKQASGVVSRKRAELKRNMLRELGERCSLFSIVKSVLFFISLRDYRSWKNGGFWRCYKISPVLYSSLICKGTEAVSC